ncbi:hypothetical protein [Spiroplasma culicicola]|uniref:Protein-export membrane protein SecG n=1 Tax=Spiroplasma culicicola AES-1 TaxID=1276246 RepID=W6AFG5_9MOLU|nr:hypothetical protein [Spiroplasma culicicola]AHI52429.1 hypothetical protein SCULI_v1c00880 [Spiroplasma culicicola AES-1]
MSQDQLINLICAVIFYTIAVICLISLLIVKRKQNVSGNVTLKQANKTGLSGIWDFTKRNILPFATIVCFVMGITFTIMIFSL